MAMTINTIRQEVYRLLNESTSSVLGQLPDGTGGTTVTSDATVRTYILDGIANICRTCVFYPVTGTYTIANNTNSTTIVTATTVNPVLTQIWYPTDAYINGTRLAHASEQSVRANDLNYKTTTTTASSSILYWYRPDNNLVNLYPGNATGASITLTLYGCGIPATPALDSTDIATFLPDDVLRQMAASYAAMMLVMKNTDDPSVASRAFWKQFYDEWRMKLWMQLDKSLKSPGGPYAIPPVPQQVAK
jgi:hypothetical protein